VHYDEVMNVFMGYGDDQKEEMTMLFEPVTYKKKDKNEEWPAGDSFYFFGSDIFEKCL
jgi:hypothetical protein